MTLIETLRNYLIIQKDQYSKNVISISERGKFFILMFYAVFITISAFFFNSPSEIILGMKKIILSPSILLTDYIELANLGAAFFNSGIIMIVAMLIVKFNKVHMSGPVVASIFTVLAFGFFGKNIYNIWAILLGAYLYSRTQVDNFSRYIVLAFFGTSLAPLVSQISFGFGLDPVVGIILGNLAGILVGIIMIPLANHFVSFHQGFNLYNMGFTAGIIATIFMAVFRSFGLENYDPHILSSGNNFVLSMYFLGLFISMILIGYFLNGNSFKGYRKLLISSGRLISDFITMYGFGLSLINMGIIGIVATLYVIIVGGQLSGMVIGGVLTVAGFGTFGKHIKNIIPIMIGVYISSLINIWDTDSVSYLIAALFGTALAPISGMFGWKIGILAGFVHSAVVMNVGYLHGGMNLYNNGFSCGIVAGVIVPLVASFRKD